MASGWLAEWKVGTDNAKKTAPPRIWRAGVILKERAIKGPTFQYELRVWREWKCDQCARTVRTRGNVSTRRCHCADPPPFMKLVEEGPKTPPDVSAFVNYQTEELTTPTEKELNEELPEWEGRAEMERKIEEKESRPRRGVGFLRAENVDDLPVTESDTSESTGSDFGDGLFEAESEDDQSDAAKEGRRSRRRGGRGRSGDKTGESSDPSADSNAEDEETPEKTGRKRRRRRNRKSRRNPDKADASPSVDPSQPQKSDQTTVAAVDSTGSVGITSDDNTNADDDGAPKKKRRRRRRRNRKRSGSEGQAGDAGPTGDTAGGDISQP